MRCTYSQGNTILEIISARKESLDWPPPPERQTETTGSFTEWTTVEQEGRNVWKGADSKMSEGIQLQL